MGSPSKHTCEICDKEFTDLSGLRHHIQLHSTDTPYSCHLCSYRGKTMKYLSKHIKFKHVPATNHECSYCGKKFHYLSNLNAHLPIHTNSRPHKCDICDKGFNSYFALSGHKNIHKAVRPYKCQYCEYACNDKSTLRKHLERHTGIQKLYQCEKCLRSYKKKFELRDHISEVHLKLDLKVKRCETCGKMFKSTARLTAHIKRVHDKAYETKCDICGLAISNRYNLKAHLRSHVDLRPFQCGFEGCGKRYKDKEALVKHSRIHYPELQHPCEECGKRFTRVERLRRHMRTHRPRVKDVTCHHCGVSFYSKNYLSKHILHKHVLRARYYCDACGYGAHNKPGLVMHIRAGHDPDLTCKLCQKVFKKYTYLKSHYWLTHFVRYKTRSKAVKTKTPVKEVKVKEEPVEEETPAENTETYGHDITRGTEAEQAAQVKELMMNAVITTSENLETLFGDLLPPPNNDDDEVGDHDYPLLCDVKCEEQAQQQIKEMLTKAQFSALEGNKRKILEKVQIDYSDDDKNQPNKSLETVSQGSNKDIDSQVSNISSSFNKNDSQISASVSNKTNDSTLTEPVTVANDTIDRGLDHVIECGNISVDNWKRKEGETSKRTKNKVNKNGRQIKKNVKKIITKTQGIDIKNKVERNYTRRKLLVTESPKVNITNKDVTGETNVTESNTETENSVSINNKGEANQSTQSMGILLNSHQCYECFLLFDTKEKLLDHCKEHYNLCNDVILKKCPFCDFVTHGSLPRHIKLMHKMDLKNIYRPSLKENESGSRYFYKVDSEVVDKIDIIPSVKNLNKMAYVKLDRRRRQEKYKAVQKTKLVKKQGEWVVEKRDINIKADDIVIPNLKDIKGDYFESLKKMATRAKQEGKSFLYPCKECEKICQTLSALKLHYRHHDPNKKPYKPKVWKHKMTLNKSQETKIPETEMNTHVDTKRYEKPKPIVNKHKCDPKLMEFYKNNIRGGDIEFWQFLKIYNRMDKDNINDFKDLESTSKFGIHIAEKTCTNNLSNDTTSDTNSRSIQTSASNRCSPESKSIKLTTTVEISRLSNRQSKFKRVVMINRKEHMRRNKLKQQLRDKMCQITAI